MASVNKVILLGNLGRDPELRYTASGSAVCSMRIATTRNWKSRDSGERQEETEWHSIVLYERLAEIAGEYLKKGRPVYIEGRLKTRKWQDKDGNDRYTTEIVAESLQLLGDGGQREEPAPSPAQSRPAPPRPAPGAHPAPSKATRTGFDDMPDDDLPF